MSETKSSAEGSIMVAVYRVATKKGTEFHVHSEKCPTRTIRYDGNGAVFSAASILEATRKIDDGLRAKIIIADCASEAYRRVLGQFTMTDAWNYISQTVGMPDWMLR